MVLVMKIHSHLSDNQIELLMEFADESFSLKRAIEFEVASRKDPALVECAMINRSIRKKLSELPTVGAAPGFRDRLMQSIHHGNASF